MTTATSTPPARLRVARAVAGAVLAIGVALLALLALMVTTEGEPGLLPLVLVLGGAIALAVAQVILRHRRGHG